MSKNKIITILAITLLIVLTVPLFAEMINRLVATVNGEPIMFSELEQLLQPVYRQYEQVYKGEELERRKRFARKQLLEQLIQNKLILQRAKEIGIEIKEALLEEQLAEVKEKFGSIEEFEEALKSEGIDLEQYKEEFNKQLTIRAMIEREVVSKVKVRPQEVVTYFNNQPDEFLQPEEVRIAHLLIKAKENPQEARKKAEAAYSQLQAGSDFTEITKKYSDGPRAEEGGDLGFIPIGQLKPELVEVIESLKDGEYSKIIETKNGYHIIMLKQRKESQQQKLSEIWDSLEDKLFRERLEKEHDAWSASLKAKAHIQIVESQ